LISKKEFLFQMILHVVVLVFFSFNWFDQEFRVDRVWFFLIYAIASVLITYFLMPKYLYNKKYGQFLVSFLAVITVLVLLEELVLEQVLYPNTERAESFPGVFVSLLGVLPLLTILSGGKFAWDALQKQAQIDELQTTIQESELQFLKSQINPHFLFNNLNNLYSYALEKSSKTPEIILEMSGVLRYMLYECKERFVPLEKEMEQLSNFIKLYKMQIEERGTINFEKKDIKTGYKIAPLILIVFIENAFKHSQSGQSSDIEIDIGLSMHSSKLKFHCKNNYVVNEGLDSVAKGIGLKNVKKRLNLLYPEKHTLRIEEKNNFFEVDLVLELEKI
jgi:hypothetical protein